LNCGQGQNGITTGMALEQEHNVSVIERGLLAIVYQRAFICKCYQITHTPHWPWM